VSFATIEFLVFFAVVLTVYRLIPAAAWRARKAWLLLASLAFYASWHAVYTLLLLYSICFDFVAAQWLPRVSRPLRPWLLLFSLLGNLGLLVFFKYGGFLYDNVTAIGVAPGSARVDDFLHGLLLPLGISFYTFHSVSYIVDVYRAQREPCRNFVDYALYVSFFPQLMSGPILRAWEFLPQLEVRQHFQSERFRAGFARVGIGLAKKVLFADVLAAYVDPVFADPTGYSPLTAMVALYAYAFQIYFDFSGYCDMALGLANMLDFKLVENFNWPYLASSVTDYWRRWHMSLSRWLRDYVYIPLGGNRHGSAATYLNLMATMLLGGLWHGANWNFVIWGGLHGLFLAVERALGVREPPTEPVARALRIALTFHLVLFAFLIFRIQHWAIIESYLATLVSGWHGPSPSDWKAIAWIVTAFSLHVADEGGRLRAWFANTPPLFQGAAVAATVILMINLRNLHQPFVYFQF